jgi:hypothetical protein
MATNRLFSGDDSDPVDVLTAQLRAAGQASGEQQGAYLPILPGYSPWQQMILQMAYQLARVIVAPPRHESILTSSWN